MESVILKPLQEKVELYVFFDYNNKYAFTLIILGNLSKSI